MDIVKSILYFLTYIILAVGFLLYKKQEDKLLLSVWLPVTAIFSMCYQAMMVGIIDLLHMPVNFLSVGIINLLLGLYLWIHIFREKQVQKYKIEMVDVVMWGILFIGILLIVEKRFSFNLNLNYNAVDPAVHLSQAMGVFRNESVDSMYYAAFHNGMLIHLLSFLVTPFCYFKLFILSDIAHLLLAGLMFFALIRKYCTTRYMQMAGIVLTGLYLVGYPLNSMLFGFSYFGMGITVIGYLLCVAQMYEEKAIPRAFLIGMLSVGCLGIFVSYMMFVPVVFFGLLVFILIEQAKEKKLISFKTIMVGMGIFLIPTIIGLLKTFSGFFGSVSDGGQGEKVASAIATEGGIYRDLFSNFVFLFPFAIFAVVRIIKNKKNSFLIWLFLFEHLFVLILFVKVLKGQVSGYYYYKNYYLLWLLYFSMIFVALQYFEKTAQEIMVYAFISYFLVLCCMVGRVEGRIATKTDALIVRYNAEAFTDIYSFNCGFLGTPPYSPEKIELFRQATLLTSEAYKVVVGTGTIEDYYWFNALTSQGDGYINVEGSNLESLQCEMNNLENDYYIVFKGFLMDAACQEFLQTHSILFENEAGYILKR